jgi:hypothetical protein
MSYDGRLIVGLVGVGIGDLVLKQRCSTLTGGKMQPAARTQHLLAWSLAR